MAVVKPGDIRNMSEAEISAKIFALKEELFKLGLEKKAGRVDKPHRIRIAKREIARCYTILKEKQNGKG